MPPASDQQKIFCETPAEGKAGTQIPLWKYQAVRAAILDAVKEAGSGGITFASLPDAVVQKLSDDDRAKLGSVSWHVTTVKLDLEVKGELKRLERKSPQRLILASQVISQ